MRAPMATGEGAVMAKRPLSSYVCAYLAARQAEELAHDQLMEDYHGEGHDERSQRHYEALKTSTACWYDMDDREQREALALEQRQDRRRGRA